MEVALFNIEGKETGKVSLNDGIFGIEPNDHAIYLDVKAIQAHKRQGTHKSKERAEIARTTKKLKKQKGTGGARAGSMRSPLFVGGGTVFGPRPRTYDLKVNKKVKRLARKSALTYKAQGNAVMVVEDFSWEMPKTAEWTKVLDKLQVADKKTLFVIGDYNKSLYLSSRNLKGSKVVNVADLSTYDLMNAKQIVFVQSSLVKLEDNLNG
jgi:large subunit ribosomal protein L4